MEAEPVELQPPNLPAACTGTTSVGAGHAAAQQQQQAGGSKAPARQQAAGRTRQRAARQRMQMDGDTDSDDDPTDDGNAGQQAGAAIDDKHSEYSYGGESSAADVAEQTPDPLYDPDADDEDEKWVADQRQGRESDAILSCPACFTTLCVDCQQHAVFTHQYRAMFVMNCQADLSRMIDPVTTGSKAGQKRGRDVAADEEDAQAGPEDYGACHPVSCEVCGTEVGVVDPQDGMYIFYNTFPSEP